MEYYKYKLMLWKKYIDRGRGWTSYFNELFLLFGFWSITANKGNLYLIGIVFAYAIFCFILGWAVFYFGWEEADIEVANRYNLFVGEMREWKQKQN